MGEDNSIHFLKALLKINPEIVSSPLWKYLQTSTIFGTKVSSLTMLYKLTNKSSLSSFNLLDQPEILYVGLSDRYNSFL